MNKKSNPNKGINPITSSDTILWDGPDLACIHLCNGDTVSDVVYKLAKEICEIKTTLDLKDLDLKCVVEICLSCPAPVKSLQVVLQLIINKVCSLAEIISKLSAGNGTADEKLVTLASCFLPMTDGDGDPITKLPVSDYVRVIANLVCNLKSVATGHEIRIDALELDVAQLLTDLNELGKLPKVQMSCITQTNAPIDIDKAVTELEKQFCQLRTVTGLPSPLTAAIGKQSSALDTEDRLGGNGTMNGITGWKKPTQTIADTVSNLWLTVLDMRGAVKAIQDNCCKVNCDSIKVDFDIKLNDDRTIMTLFFANKSRIPVGFKDCDALGNLLHITDAAGAAYDFRVKVAEEASDINGIQFDLTGTPLDQNLDYFLQMDACMTNGDLTCSKCVNKTITYKNLSKCCAIKNTGTVASTIIYKTCIPVAG